MDEKTKEELETLVEEVQLLRKAYVEKRDKATTEVERADKNGKASVCTLFLYKLYGILDR